VVACGNKKMKVRQTNDYKSIALPAELQGHGLFCRINSLFNQVIQYKINLYLARMLRMLAVKVPQCRAIVTHLSVYESVWESYLIWDFSKFFFFIKTNQNGVEKEYESNQVLK
jgi:hypothetical protein